MRKNLFVWLCNRLAICCLPRFLSAFHIPPTYAANQKGQLQWHTSKVSRPFAGTFDTFDTYVITANFGYQLFIRLQFKSVTNVKCCCVVLRSVAVPIFFSFRLTLISPCFMFFCFCFYGEKEKGKRHC